MSSALAEVDNLKLVGLSPCYYSGRRVVFLAGAGNSDAAILKSVYNRQSFELHSVRDLATGQTFSIDTWVIGSDSALFIGSYDGSNGLLYRTTDGGLTYSTGALAGSQPLKSIALSPNYGSDETILVGSSNGGRVYWSNNGCTVLEQLGVYLAPVTA